MTLSAGPRPELRKDSGVNSIRLDVALTRDELALTLDQLFAKFNLRLLAKDNAFGFGVMALALCAATGMVGARLTRRNRG